MFKSVPRLPGAAPQAVSIKSSTASPRAAPFELLEAGALGGLWTLQLEALFILILLITMSAPGAGHESPSKDVSWQKRDVLLFANSIGCKADELHFLFVR